MITIIRKIVIRIPGIIVNIHVHAAIVEPTQKSFIRQNIQTHLQDMFDAVQQRKLWDKKCLPLGGTNQVCGRPHSRNWPVCAICTVCLREFRPSPADHS